MISANLGVFLAIGLVAGGHHDHRRPRPGSCNDCGVETAGVRRQVEALRGSPKKDRREDAAEDLRKLDWRCHPDAVLALCDALALDRSDDVREQAAESLRKMAPCVPAVHEALSRAAASDPDHGVRKEARKALGSLGRRCIADCRACGPPPTGSVIQGPTIIPDDWVPILAPREDAGPSSAPKPAVEPRLEALPPAIPDGSALPEIPPPPVPVPVPLEGPVSAP